MIFYTEILNVTTSNALGNELTNDEVVFWHPTEQQDVLGYHIVYGMFAYINMRMKLIIWWM